MSGLALEKKHYQKRRVHGGPIMGLLVICRRKRDLTENPRESVSRVTSYAEFGACNKDCYLEMADKSEDRD